MSTLRQEQAKLIEKLMKRKDCHFQKHEIEKLIVIFLTHVRGSTGKLDRVKFRDILHEYFDMTDDILMDRVFRAFDKDNDSYLSQEEWVIGLSTFLKGAIGEKTRYCFDVYDLNGDGYISREEMFQLLKTSLTRHQSDEDPDEGIKDLVELTLKKMDLDHDSRLSYADFETSVRAEPLLIEAFGPCLPSPEKKSNFFTKLEES